MKTEVLLPCEEKDQKEKKRTLEKKLGKKSVHNIGGEAKFQNKCKRKANLVWDDKQSKEQRSKSL